MKIIECKKKDTLFRRGLDYLCVVGFPFRGKDILTPPCPPFHASPFHSRHDRGSTFHLKVVGLQLGLRSESSPAIVISFTDPPAPSFTFVHRLFMLVFSLSGGEQFVAHVAFVVVRRRICHRPVNVRFHVPLHVRFLHDNFSTEEALVGP